MRKLDIIRRKIPNPKLKILMKSQILNPQNYRKALGVRRKGKFFITPYALTPYASRGFFGFGHWDFFWILSFVIGILYFHIYADSLQAQQESTLRLQDIVKEALEKNPGILAAKERWKAAMSVPSQVKTLPDPKIMWELENIGIGGGDSWLFSLGDEDMSKMGFSISQEIPFPGKLSLKGKKAERRAERLKELYRNTQLDVISRLKVAYYELYFIYKSIEITNKNKDLLERFEKTAEALYSVGRGIQQDVLKAQVEISRLLDDLVMLEQRKETANAMINSILNRSPMAPLGKPVELKEPKEFKVTLEMLNQMAFQNSPLLKAENQAIAGADTALSLARKEYLPDFMISAGWSTRDSLREMWMVQVGVTIPLYYRTKQRYRVEETVSSLAKARQSYQNTRQEVLFKVKDLFVQAKATDKLISLYKTGIIPQATLSLESAIAGYEVGRLDFLTLLDNIISLLNDELKYHEQVVNLYKIMAKLEEVVGISLM